MHDSVLVIGWVFLILGAAFAIYFTWWVIGCLRAWVFYPRPRPQTYSDAWQRGWNAAKASRHNKDRSGSEGGPPCMTP